MPTLQAQYSFAASQHMIDVPIHGLRLQCDCAAAQRFRTLNILVRHALYMLQAYAMWLGMTRADSLCCTHASNEQCGQKASLPRRSYMSFRV